MSLTNTNIKLQRSVNKPSELEDQLLNFGEPLFIDNTTVSTGGFLQNPCNAYLVLGRKEKPEIDSDPITVKKSPVIKAMSLERANNLVFYNGAGGIIDESGNPLPVDRITATAITKEGFDPTDATKYHILCQPDDGSNEVYKFTLDDLGIFINRRGVTQGIAWNDYAEFRPCADDVAAGYVVCDIGNNTMELSKRRLQCCPHVVSDTYGHVIGENTENSVPIAVAGRVLVAMDFSFYNLKVGDCVCAGANGLASKMTRQEIINYPDRILGVVCEEPDQSSIEAINLENKVWINIK